MVTLWRQLARIFVFFVVATAFAALTTFQTRAAPYAAYVMDARTGEELYSRNAETRLHPASLTKMMTLYITFDAIERGEISLDTMVTVTKHAASQPPSRLGLKAGQRIALRYLIRAAAVKSANDAAAAIGDALGGSEERFAARMNRTAKAIGMTNSTFKNAHGLTVAGHLSTARDMSVLGRRLFYDFPEYYNIFSRRSADAGMAQVNNTNRRFLDSYEGADGIKTGYTVAAGFNLTASAERGSKRIIATVFGGTSTAQRNAKMAELLDIGFKEAPRNVRERPPAPADIPVDNGPDLVAEAIGAGVAAAKTIRVSMVMKTSPRPLARPGRHDPAVQIAAAEAVGAIQSSIEDAVAAAAAPAGAAAPEAAPIAVATAAPEAAAIMPFQVVDSDGAPIRPEARPGSEPEAAVETELAALEPETEVIVSTATDPTEMAAAQPLPFEVIDAPLATASALPFAVISPEDLPPETVVALSAPAPSTPALPEEAMPILRPLPVASAGPVQSEVVTRLSTSDSGRNWGISLGRMNSRGAAERIMTKAALSESVALSDGLRKIVSRSGGYDATFLGLTQQEASLACQRMAAKLQDCELIAP